MMKKNLQLASWLSVSLGAAIFSNVAFADGSKDLYPSTAKGYRSYLMTSANSGAFNPFPNNGVHKVYAKAGETIYAGSSAVGIAPGSGGSYASVKIVSPSGTVLASTASNEWTTTGKIADRTQEINGPNRTGVSSGYNPLKYEVPAGEEGIYEVQFTGFGNNTNFNTADKYNANASSWTQYKSYGTASATTATSLILAWDVSVGDDATGKLVPGRVYSTTINLTGPNSEFNNRSFYGKFYVLTPQGFVYEVDNNGQNGAAFNFFSNNKGAVSTSNVFTSAPSYKSVNTSTLADLEKVIWDPRKADGSGNITNKIFYTKPDLANFPESADIGIGGTKTTTWLKGSPVKPEAQNLIANCKGQIWFESNVDGRYEIYIDANNNGSNDDAVDVILRGECVKGINNINWDGKNGNGVAVDLATVKLTVRVTVAEVHFPFVDVEANKGGIIIKRLNSDMTINNDADTIFWNDNGISNTTGKPSPIFTNSGIKSSVNGHKWNETTTSAGDGEYFGNNKTLDTWTYVFDEASSSLNYGGCLTISGKVWNDADGDGSQSSTESSINGKNTSGSTTYTGAPLYVYLTNENGAIISKAEVNTDGTYTLQNVERNVTGFKVFVSSENKSICEVISDAILPEGWFAASENKGTNNAATDIKSGDGLVNLKTGAISITGLNFGIQQAPETVTNEININTVIPSGGYVEIPGNAFINPFDAEDDKNTSDFDGGSIDYIKLVEFPSTVNKIIYNGEEYTKDNFPAEGLIMNYDPNNGVEGLIIYPKDGVDRVELPIAAIDNLGAEDPTPGKLIINFETALKIDLAYFNAKVEGCEVNLDWRLNSDNNESNVEVERSHNGTQYNAVGTIAVREGNHIYNAIDQLSDNQSVYYRLKLNDAYYPVAYSKVVKIDSKCNEPIISLYPNPAEDIITINGLQAGYEVVVYNVLGEKVLLSNEATFNINALTSGKYFVEVLNTQKVMIQQLSFVKK